MHVAFLTQLRRLMYTSCPLLRLQAGHDLRVMLLGSSSVSCRSEHGFVSSVGHLSGLQVQA